MMKIQWLGHACFKIIGSHTVVTDPFEGIGFDLPKVSADVVTVSHAHSDHNASHLVGGEPAIVQDAGGHSVSGLSVTGYRSFHDDVKGAKRGQNLIFEIYMDGVRLVHLGDLGEKPDDNVIGAIKNADVLFIPVGGNYTIDGMQAAEFISIVQPKVAIPMHYKTKGLAADVAPIDSFLKAVGGHGYTKGSETLLEPGLPRVLVFEEKA